MMNILKASLKRYNIAVFFFECQLIEDSPADLLTKKIEAIFDGWRVITKPIAQGNHEVFFKGVILDAAPMCSTGGYRPVVTGKLCPFPKLNPLFSTLDIAICYNLT